MRYFFILVLLFCINLQASQNDGEKLFKKYCWGCHHETSMAFGPSFNQIANQIHVNPSHLSRKFKEDTGVNITEFINQKRIEEAKLYLKRGNISITDIAFMVGFNDLNYFSKVFKKLTSVTPSQYAKRRK